MVWPGALQHHAKPARFSHPSAALARTIPTAAEAKQAAEILKQFAEAEEVFHANDRGATRAEIGRKFRVEKIFDLQKKLASQDPHKFGEAAGKMKETARTCRIAGDNPS